MLSAILFDLDGTLANTDPLHFLTWQDVLKDFEMSIDKAFYDQHISGRQNAKIVADILPQLSLEEGLKLAIDKESRFREIATQLQPLAGLKDFLNWIDHNHLQKAVVTNAPRENAEFMLTTLKLDTTFPMLILAEDAIKGKPDPAPYLLALEKLNITPSEAIVFEDSPSGIKSAVGAKLFTIGVASTHHPDNLYAAGANMVISDFTDSQLWELLANK